MDQQKEFNQATVEAFYAVGEALDELWRAVEEATQRIAVLAAKIGEK